MDDIAREGERERDGVMQALDTSGIIVGMWYMSLDKEEYTRTDLERTWN